MFLNKSAYLRVRSFPVLNIRPELKSKPQSAKQSWLNIIFHNGTEWTLEISVHGNHNQIVLKKLSTLLKVTLVKKIQKDKGAERTENTELSCLGFNDDSGLPQGQGSEDAHLCKSTLTHTTKHFVAC